MKSAYYFWLPIVIGLLLLAIGFTAFTAFVAYSGMHPFSLPEAFNDPPSPHSAQYGAVFDSALNWAMRVCGAALTILGAALAIHPRSVEQVLGSCVIVLGGIVLVTQHWAAGIALGVVAISIVIASTLRQRSEPQR